MLVVAVLAAPSATAAGTHGREAQRVRSRASAGGHAPQIRGASLKQDGPRLVWYVNLQERFHRITTLERKHQSLCLLLEWRHGGAVWGELCAASAPRGPVLRYRPIGPHRTRPFRTVPATVTYPHANSLRASFTPASAHTSYHSTLRWQTETLAGPAVCTLPSNGPNPCERRLPRRPTLLRLHVPQPVGCVAKGPEWVFHGPSSGRMIALTFDDGPWYDTPQFLNVLERKHVVATFFQIGDQISEYGQHGALERRMLRDGDMIGDHTWSHPDVSGGGSFAATQIRETADAIRGATGFYPCLFRAPYGSVSTALLNEARQMGFTTVQWDIDPRDWSLPGSAAIYQNVVSNAHPGAIVLQHDGGGPRYETLQALPGEIDTLRARGYRFVTITQMLGYRLIYK